MNFSKTRFIGVPDEGVEEGRNKSKVIGVGEVNFNEDVK